MSSKSQSAEDAQAMKYLAGRFETIMAIAKFSSDSHSEPWTLAHAIIDIEQSLNRLLSEVIPSLKGSGTSDELLLDFLLEMGEELSHIEYHLMDCKFLEYLEGRNRDE